MESTVALLERARAGDLEAREALFARCLPALRRWARGRLPSYARDLLDTHDLVQDTLLSALKHIDRFQPRHDGALIAYLRQALSNRIRDEIRRMKRRPTQAVLESGIVDDDATPLEKAIGREAIGRYEHALAKLAAEDREAIVLRVELHHSYDEIARLLGKSSADSARMTVVRALAKLAREMERGS